MSENPFRLLPAVDKILVDERITALCERYPHELVTEQARLVLDDCRRNISNGEQALPFDDIVEMIIAGLNKVDKPSLFPLINATGVILHTNLGRAPLSTETIKAMADISRTYCNLEFNLDDGKRGSRYVHVVKTICRITGAEDALVVNNNAASVLLTLSALAKRKEVIISRGQGVQIGGGFRIPEVMRQSGAKLVEVGATNCTYIEDYENAITQRTAALLEVHSSNFKITGFTHSATMAELVQLGEKYGLPLLHDIGSGALFDTTKYGLDAEPTVQESLQTGASLVCFSGDKLLGGPQAGIIAGRRELIAKLKKHPLTRTVRIDKVRLAGLEATLAHYLRGEAEIKIPILSMITQPLAEIKRRAGKWAKILGKGATTQVGKSTVGGGSLPGSTLPTQLLVIKPPSRVNAQEFLSSLRDNDPPVIARLQKNLVLIDPRTVFPGDEEKLMQALRRILTGSMPK